MKVRSVLLAFAATSLLLVAGCSSDGSDGGSDPTDEVTTAPAGDGTAPSADGAPTADEVSAGVQQGFNVSPDQGACAAEELADAGLPAESLQAIADADPESLSEDDRQAVAEALQAAIAACP